MDYSVLDFGALGNGTDSDTAAIQAAIDACAAGWSCPAGGPSAAGLWYSAPM